MSAFKISPASAFAAAAGPIAAPDAANGHAPSAAGLPGNKLAAMTVDLLTTMSRIDPQLRLIEKLPQRCLTNPSEPLMNDGMDNEDANLICRVHDQIVSPTTTYTIMDLLGTGTFGQVFKCVADGSKQAVAIKVIKNKVAYHNQGLLEIKIARLLNTTYDPRDERHIVRLLDSFVYKNHVCVVFELLSMSLLDILTQNQFRGLPLSVVQRFTQQIVSALVAMQDASIIHCDLKPENILLAPPRRPGTGRQASPGRPAKKSKADVDANQDSAAAAAAAAAAVDRVGTARPPSLLLAADTEPAATGAGATRTSGSFRIS
jgi:serine/threonine protein kinase